MTRPNVSSGSPLEPTIGFSRATRIGQHVFVADTASIGSDGTVGIGDAAAQARRCIEISEQALAETGRLCHSDEGRISSLASGCAALEPSVSGPFERRTC